MEVLDVDLDVLEEEDVALPAELGRRAAVEEVDEGREVPADRDPGQLPRRGRGEPGRAVVVDLLAVDQGEEAAEIALADLEGGEVDGRDAAVVIDLVQEEGEIGEADEQGAPGPDDAQVLGVDLADEVLGARSPGHGDDQVELADGLFKDCRPSLDRGRDVVDLGVARVKMGAEVELSLIH